MNFISYFDGLMLSDGCLTKQKLGKNYYYAQNCKYKEWLDNICYNFYVNNITTKVYNPKTFTGNFGINTHHSLKTNSILFLTTQHERWYIKDYNVDNYSTRLWHYDKETEEWFVWNKIVPKDICLTPECVANWYLGDGSFYKKKYHVNSIQLATNGFTKKDTEYLNILLNDYIVNYSHIYEQTTGKYLIKIYRKSSIDEFFNYIKDCEVPECYNYKFPKELLT